MKRSKLYCYIDETGQDAKGAIFITAVVVSDREQAVLEKFLLACEQLSGKGIKKWTHAPYQEKAAYIAKVVGKSGVLEGKIYFELHGPRIDYDHYTIQTIGRSLKNYIEEFKLIRPDIIVLVDGLNERKIQEYRRSLSRVGLHSVAVRGVRDQSNAIIRLADSIAGCTRDAEEGNGYFQQIINKSIRRGLIVKL